MESEENPISTDNEDVNATKQNDDVAESNDTNKDVKNNIENEVEEKDEEKEKEEEIEQEEEIDKKEKDREEKKEEGREEKKKDREEKKEEGREEKETEREEKKDIEEKKEQENEDKEEKIEKEDEKGKDGDKEKKSSKKKSNGDSGGSPSRSSKSQDSKMRDHMLAELERVRKDMMSSASQIRKPEVKPYAPDIFNDLSPYYNTYLVNYAMHDQDLIQKPWGSYCQRQTAVNIVEPEISLKMDTFPLPPVPSNVPGQMYRIKVWSKNLSGKDKDLGSTRLPPVPSLGVKKLPNPEYQYFRMTYNEVPRFREDVRKMYSSIEEQRAQADYDRVQKDWKRMNLDELKELPERSRFHYGKAITTYLGTSRGSLKAVNRLGGNLNGP